ncbi:SGT1 protein-domain-containing protein [Pseudomassariella vexata]|uniref:SGT1 protein-domain-containing protein n=1 Tax=Pseudomassariella vexata TaxID=1141098 RepID=A0A1Y2E728_9PEZI|nr:SGT1 protein-domain-containing protein [Pseudomassariella vexata]ORY67076.1 SGT1 protein-domain-containing protein [Pseudomassariella vexata]
MNSTDQVDFFEDSFKDFPRRLPENCVEYVLFVIDGQLETRKVLSTLDGVRKAALQLSDKLTKDYIWQRDSFQLDVKHDKGLVYLQGITYYGDSVEDEWLIVYLLRELTKSFQSLWVAVYDSDGEFLLIEAANVLPRWLSPEIDTNRVWIHAEKLYIIPLDHSSPEKRPLALAEAVDYLKTRATSLVHSSFVEAEAFYRLEKYPGQIKSAMHRSLVTIPRKLAYILHQKPGAIAPAVEAFYLRDPPSMKALLAETGKFSFPPEDLVTASVRFTKVLFAQLKSQQFTPPPVWHCIIEATEKVSGNTEEAGLKLARLEMGMKVTSGFEMLATNAETKDSRVAREVAILLKDLEEDGAEALPSDITMLSWPDAAQDDDESWMDINYEDFEQELQGQHGSGKGKKSGFGDTAAQADLHKIVERFELFLNDDTAGAAGAELEDMDDDDFSDEDDSEDEDKEVSFDEQQFARMMREMMGLLPEETQATHGASTTAPRGQAAKFVEELSGSESESEDEVENIKRLAAQMGAELNEYSALRLDPTPTKLKAVKDNDGQKVQTKGKGKQAELNDEEDVQDEESEDGEVNIDYNLAKNLLESFKSQAGMAGPAGNILGMMGMQLPRDDEDTVKK